MSSRPLTTGQIEDELRSLLAERPEIELCFLFGSAVTGRRGPESDIDVAVCGKRPLPPASLAQLQIEMCDGLGAEVDLLDISRLEGLILREVLTRGIRIINRNPPLLAHYIKKVLYFSEDMLPNYRMIAEANVRRFIRGKP